jgi:hypothetical protein
MAITNISIISNTPQDIAKRIERPIAILNGGSRIHPAAPHPTIYQSYQQSIAVPIKAGPSRKLILIRDAEPQKTGPGDEYFGREYGIMCRSNEAREDERGCEWKA